MAELGALSLRIQEQGGDQVLTKLRAIDGAAKLTGVSVDQAAKALNRLGIAAKVSGGQIVVAEQEVTRASGIVKQLGSDAVVTAGQVDQTTASVTRLGTRAAVTDTQVTKLSPKLRSGASAVAALAIAASTGGGSLAGMATQAGLVGSVMASEFAPAKWAGYAAGIGAAVIAVTALVGILKRLHDEASKPRELVTQHIDAIRIRGLAEEEARRRREELDRARANLATQPAPLTVETIRANMRARAAVNRAEAENAAAVKKLAELTSAQSKELQTAAIEGVVRAAEATRTVRLSEIAKEQAQVEAAFQAGTADLKSQYDARRKAILDGAAAERAALEAARKAKLTAVPGEDPQGADAQERRVEAQGISAEIKALANETSARLTALDTQRAADERALAGKVLAYEAQIEAVRDTAFEKRRAQIQAEAEERRKAVFQATGDEAQANAARDELIGQRTTELLLAKAQSDLARLQLSLDTARQRIANDLAAGRLSELEASQQVADAERSAVPEMQRLVALALQFATALGDDGAVAAIQKMRAELQGLGVDLLDPVLVAQKQVQSQLGSLGTELGSVFADSIAAAASGGSGKSAILRGLGGIFSDMGRALIAYGVAMLKLLPALTNPFTSGPAALIAGAALVALGSTLGAAAGGRGGGGSATSGGSLAPQPISISRFVVDPNAGVRQRIAGAGMQQVASAGPTPRPIEVIGINTPRGQELIGTAAGRYQGRGG